MSTEDSWSKQSLINGLREMVLLNPRFTRQPIIKGSSTIIQSKKKLHTEENEVWAISYLTNDDKDYFCKRDIKIVYFVHISIRSIMKKNKHSELTFWSFTNHENINIMIRSGCFLDSTRCINLLVNWQF